MGAACCGCQAGHAVPAGGCVTPAESRWRLEPPPVPSPLHPPPLGAARKDSLLPAAKKRPNLTAADAVKMQQDAAAPSSSGGGGGKGR